MRVATFNVLHGVAVRDGAAATAGDRPPGAGSGLLGAAVAELAADVLGLQEVDIAQPRSGGRHQVRDAAEAMAAEHWRFAPAVRGTPGEHHGRWQAPGRYDAARAAAGEPTDALYGVGLVPATGAAVADDGLRPGARVAASARPGSPAAAADVGARRAARRDRRGRAGSGGPAHRRDRAPVLRPRVERAAAAPAARLARRPAAAPRAARGPEPARPAAAADHRVDAAGARRHVPGHRPAGAVRPRARGRVDPPSSRARGRRCTGSRSATTPPSRWTCSCRPGGAYRVGTIAYAVWPRAAIAETCASPVTRTGVERSVAEPFPSWPRLPRPHAHTAPGPQRIAAEIAAGERLHPGQAGDGHRDGDVGSDGAVAEGATGRCAPGPHRPVGLADVPVREAGAEPEDAAGQAGHRHRHDLRDSIPVTELVQSVAAPRPGRPVRPQRVPAGPAAADACDARQRRDLHRYRAVGPRGRTWRPPAVRNRCCPRTRCARPSGRIRCSRHWRSPSRPSGPRPAPARCCRASRRCRELRSDRGPRPRPCRRTATRTQPRHRRRRRHRGQPSDLHRRRAVGCATVAELAKLPEPQARRCRRCTPRSPSSRRSRQP